MVLFILPLLLIFFWAVLLGRQGLIQLPQLLRDGKGRRNNLDSKEKAAPFKTILLSEPFVGAMEKYRVFDRFQLQIGSYHTKLIVLNGNAWSLDQTKSMVAEAAAYGYTALSVSSLLGALANEPLLPVIGGIMGILLAVKPIMEASRKVERRKQDILLELPETISKLLLLVSAGETVLQAMARCLEGKDANSHPLYKEWRKVVRSLETGDSFSTALERFNRSCAVQEVSVFTTVLLLNYRRGGEHFTLALRELSYTLWEKRKAVARSRGEEASSKLVFPLVGILLALMVLVAAPAVLLMG